MKKFLAILLIAMVACDNAPSLLEALKDIIDYTLEQLYNSLKELGIIDKLREFIKEGKKVFSDKCCEYVSQKMCKKYCQKIFGLIQE